MQPGVKATALTSVTAATGSKACPLPGGEDVPSGWDGSVSSTQGELPGKEPGPQAVSQAIPADAPTLCPSIRMRHGLHPHGLNTITAERPNNQELLKKQREVNFEAQQNYSSIRLLHLPLNCFLVWPSAKRKKKNKHDSPAPEKSPALSIVRSPAKMPVQSSLRAAGLSEPLRPSPAQDATQMNSLPW